MRDRNYTLMISELRKADAGSISEMVSRFAILATGFSFVAIWQQDIALFLWFIAYSTLHGFYISALWRQKGPVSRATYYKFIAVAVAAIIMFDGVVIYLWQSGEPVCQFAGVALLIGQSMFSLSRHRMLRDLSIVESIAISMTSIGIAVLLGLKYDSMPVLFGCLFISLLMSAHFVGSMREGYLDQQRLLAKESQRAREERLRSVGQLTAGVAHDFNNTMTAVLGHLELFSHSDDPQTQREYVYAARQSANRAVDLTQQLLAYARKAPLEPTMHDLVPLLSEVAQDHDAVFESRLEVNLPETLNNLAPFWVDGGRLQNAVANLLKNAEEALGPNGSVQLSAALDTIHTDGDRETLAKGTYVAISVSDDGTGIPAEYLDHVTEPFWSTKGHAHGSGLGLAMAQGFAEQSGGRLDILSKHGKGTVVTLRLPYIT